MKHLLNFDTVAEYDAVKDSLEHPYVVTIDENNGLKYNTDVIRVPNGQGGGSEGEASGMKYYSAPPKGAELAKLTSLSMITKVEIEGMKIILPMGSLLAMEAGDVTFLAFGVDITSKVSGLIFGLEGFVPISDVLANLGLQPTPITKEEFYAL